MLLLRHVLPRFLPSPTGGTSFFTQVTKSFLARLDSKQNFSSDKTLLFKEFIDGVKPNDSYDQGPTSRIPNSAENFFGQLFVKKIFSKIFKF
jgi:hypothetical protein